MGWLLAAIAPRLLARRLILLRQLALVLRLRLRVAHQLAQQVGGVERVGLLLPAWPGRCGCSLSGLAGLRRRLERLVLGSLVLRLVHLVALIWLRVQLTVLGLVRLLRVLRVLLRLRVLLVLLVAEEQLVVPHGVQGLSRCAAGRGRAASSGTDTAAQPLS